MNGLGREESGSGERESKAGGKERKIKRGKEIEALIEIYYTFVPGNTW